MKKIVFACLLWVSFIFTFYIKSYSQIKYPVAKKEPFDTVIYGKKITDEYGWMSLPQHDSAMKEYSKLQGILTNQILDSIPGGEIITALRKKIIDGLNPELMSFLGHQNDMLYYYREIAGRDKPVLFRRKGVNGNEEEYPGVDIFTVKVKKYTVKRLVFAFKKPLIALMMTEAGESNPHIRFYDLVKKDFLKDSIAPVMFNDSRGVSMAWLPDDKGLIYTQAPPGNSNEEKYYRGRLKVHLLGIDPANDVAVFGKDIVPGIEILDHETPYVYSFPLSPYIIARIRAGKGDNYAFAVHYSRLNGNKTPWIRLKNYICNDGGFTAKEEFLYGVTDDAPNRRMVKVNLNNGEQPAVFLPEQEKILEGTILASKNFLFAKYTSPGRSGILKIRYDDPRPIDITLPYDGTVSNLKIVGDNDLLFMMDNWTRDMEYYAANHPSNQARLIPKGGGASPYLDSFTSKVIYVPSRDGLKIPVSLVYSKNITPGEKPQRLLIDAYGCGGTSMDPVLNIDNFVWLGMGGIYAVAHIRGGGELGAEWTKAGSYPNKMNSINDFVDVADYLVRNNYTEPAKLASIGASCGTLNVGLAALQRPDLFAASVYEVGTPDFVTARETSYGRGQNIFGPLDTEDGFKARLSISAYHHIVENKNAPAMLIINGGKDYIIKLHNVARYVARLQNVQKSERPVLFLVDWEGGHANAGMNRQDRIRKWKFLFWQTGHPDFQLKTN